jgi:hypothetical protein
MVKHSKHEFYDFRNPPNRSGFGWEEINKEWQKWTTAQYVIALNHKLAIDGFKSDFDLPAFFTQTGLRAESIEKVNVPRIWSLVMCPNG